MSRRPIRLVTIAENDTAAEAIERAQSAALGDEELKVIREHDAWRALDRLAGGEADGALVDSRGVEADALKILRLAIDNEVRAPIVVLRGMLSLEFAARAVEYGAADCVTFDELESPVGARLLRVIVERSLAVATARSDAEAYRRQIEEKSRQLAEALQRSGLEWEVTLHNERVTAIEQFIVTVRHEVNNPLAMLLGRLQLLAKKSADLPEDVRLSLKEIASSALRIREIMDKLELARDGRTTGYLGGRRIKLD